jgi:epoxyqueuosine reductase
MSLEAKIKQKALELGFNAVGITTADPVDPAHIDTFRKWLDDGCAAKMAYMHRNIDKRFDPEQLLKGAKSVICVALNYRPQNSELTDAPSVRIARFALYEDYHPFIKNRLFQLAEFIQSQTIARSAGIKFKACVDSVPLAERALAQRAGLGFVGKNHMLINPELGSQFLLGELITTVELQPDEPFEQIPCGDCGRCIRACPTGALGFDGSFDARKCISYLTIEAPAGNADVSPANIFQPPPPCGGLPLGRGRAKNYIFGCDECILACPHELNAAARKNTDFQFHPEWQDLTREKIQAMTEDEFQTTFAGSGFIRGGLERLKRNC